MSAKLRPIEGEKIITPRQRLIPIPWSEIHNLPRREPVIGGRLDRRGMSVVFGGAKTGETFFTLDLSACVALDRNGAAGKVGPGSSATSLPRGGWVSRRGWRPIG